MSEGSYISFGVEGVPYSQVRIEILKGDSGEDIANNVVSAVAVAKQLADEYAKVFVEPYRVHPQQEPRTGAPAEVLHQGNVGNAPPPDEEYEPYKEDRHAPDPVRVPLDAGGHEVAQHGDQLSAVRVTGERFACPNCHKPAQQSLDQYQLYETAPDGRDYPQKWFCPNKDCSTKSMWRSKLVPLVAAGASR